MMNFIIILDNPLGVLDLCFGKRCYCHQQKEYNQQILGNLGGH